LLAIAAAVFVARRDDVAAPPKKDAPRLAGPGILVAGADPPQMMQTQAEPIDVVVDGDGTVWVAETEASQVERIGSGADPEIYEMPGNPTALAAGEEGLWVVMPFQDKVALLDPDNGDVRAIDVPSGTDSVTSGGGRGWLGNGIDSTLTPIDPDTLELGRPIRTGARPRSNLQRQAIHTAVEFADGGVWMISNYFYGHLTRVDAGTLKVQRVPVRIAEDGFGHPPNRANMQIHLAASDDQIWIGFDRWVNFATEPLQLIELPDLTHHTIGTVPSPQTEVRKGVLDLALEGGDLWIVTPDGLVRAEPVLSCVGEEIRRRCSMPIEDEIGIAAARRVFALDGRVWVTVGSG
ncbi:MAG: hypothetical protein M3345_04770, partial [Actinomycetota bacterium]|nr:hypothetical protein [Actinomycetota bacterium]